MADVVIVGPGNAKAIAQGIAAAGKGATVVQFTATPPEDEMTLKPHDLYFNETRLVPSYSCGPDDTREAMALVERSVLRAADLVTHRFPLERVVEAYAMAQKPESLKVIVTFRIASGQPRRISTGTDTLSAGQSPTVRPIASTNASAIAIERLHERLATRATTGSRDARPRAPRTRKRAVEKRPPSSYAGVGNYGVAGAGAAGGGAAAPLSAGAALLCITW